MKNNKSDSISISLQIIIILIWALPQMSTDIYLPSLPAMAHYFKQSLSSVQYTIFAYTVGYSIGALLFGPISDRVGRKPIIVWSLIVAGFTSGLALFAVSVHELIIIRIIQGFAMVGVASTIRTVVKDVSPSVTAMAKLGSLLGITIPVASAIAPIIGGYIQKYFYWQVCFGFILVYVLIFIIYTIYFLPETHHDRLSSSAKYIIHDYIEVLSNKVFLRYNVLTAFALCSTFAYLTISPYLLQVKLGLTPELFGYTSILTTVGLILSGFANRKIVSKCHIDKAILVGMVLMSISGLFFIIGSIFLPKSIVMVLISMGIMIFGSGFIYPNASAGGLSLFRNKAGTASSIYTSVQMLGGAIGSGLVSIIISHYTKPQQFLGVLILIQAIVGIVFAYQNHKNNLQSVIVK